MGSQIIVSRFELHLPKCVHYESLNSNWTMKMCDWYIFRIRIYCVQMP